MASQQELNRILSELRALDERQRYNRMAYFKPYPKQAEFLALGATHRERMLFGGNRVGKTETGSFEAACHLTGRYPDWWTGKRYTEPTLGWMCGESSLVVRDVQQEKLCGVPGVNELFGTGMIPRECFIGRPSLSRGITDAFDTIHVRHISGGVSVAQFKSYEQGRPKFQGSAKDWIWLDEEPDETIYTECLARITERDGLVFTTFTPLKGRTKLVTRFLDEPDDNRVYVTLRAQDAPHLTPEIIAKALSGYPVHEHGARMDGTPMQGEGRVFPWPQELITEAPLTYVPLHWAKLWAVDFGVGHPFAAVLLLHDRDNDVVHVHDAIRVRTKPGEPGGMPINHAARMKAIGAAVPVAWPHDGSKREHEGVTIAAQYRRQGLLMLPTHATHRDGGGFGVEAGILAWGQRMQNGQFKVAAHLSDWFEEYLNYHRKDGLIVKVNDDLMSATRIGIMDIRHARVVNLGGRVGKLGDGSNIAEGLDFTLT